MSAAAEKQQQVVRGNTRVGSVMLQQMGHRVVEVWREGDVGSVNDDGDNDDDDGGE